MARSQSEPGSQVSPEAPSDLRPEGVDPSRMNLPVNLVQEAARCLAAAAFLDYPHVPDDLVLEVLRAGCGTLEKLIDEMEAQGVLLTDAPQGMEARSAETSGSARKGDSPVGEADAPIPSPTPEP